jgi:hypothetical protein
MKWHEALMRRSPAALARVASVLTLIALAIMVYSILVPKVLPVMIAMSIGHAIGFAGFGCFSLAVLIDIASKSRKPPSVPGPGS